MLVGNFGRRTTAPLQISPMTSSIVLPGRRSPTGTTIIPRRRPARSAPAPGRPSATPAVASQVHAHSAVCRACARARVTASLGLGRRSNWTVEEASVAIHLAVTVSARRARVRVRRSAAANAGAMDRDARAPMSAARGDDCLASQKEFFFFSIDAF